MIIKIGFMMQRIQVGVSNKLRISAVSAVNNKAVIYNEIILIFMFLSAESVSYLKHREGFQKSYQLCKN